MTNLPPGGNNAKVVIAFKRPQIKLMEIQMISDHTCKLPYSCQKQKKDSIISGSEELWHTCHEGEGWAPQGSMNKQTNIRKFLMD